MNPLETDIWLYNDEPAPIPLRGYSVMVRKKHEVYESVNGKKRVYDTGRSEYFHESVSYPPMEYDEAVKFIQAVQNKEVWITYWDVSLNRPTRRLFYFGDVSFHPTDYKDVGKSVRRPSRVEDISVEIIDLGQDDRSG